MAFADFHSLSWVGMRISNFHNILQDRESKAVDTESLCILAGRSVWAIRVDIHVLDNGG